jgi:hypothetical protein
MNGSPKLVIQYWLDETNCLMGIHNRTFERAVLRTRLIT